ncbi:MAG: hypothetical protein HDS58_03165 [Barnesiella sp.]|nr:hypothetical protein [Barnesiella sp.]
MYNKQKLIALSLLTAMFTACSSDEPKIGIEENEANSYVAKRSIEEAIEIASQYADQTTADSRATGLVVDKTTVSAILSTTSRALNDTLMYAVNFEDNNGYMIISANKSIEPILAIIDDGNYQDDEQAKVDGFDYFMNAASAYVQGGIDLRPGLKPDPDGPVDLIMVFYADSVEIGRDYEKRIAVTWGTGSPENLFCENGDVGCGPVAIAQVLSYFKPSMSFDVTFEGRPYSHLNLTADDWDGMMLHKRSIIHSICKASDEQHEKLAVLLRQIGVWTYAQYLTTNETFSYPSYSFSKCNELLANKYITFVEQGEFYDNLKDGGVALVQGADASKNMVHIWVLDGVASINYRVTTYTHYNPKTHEYLTKEVTLESKKYVHCNWGKSGVKDGYFSESVFNDEAGTDFKEPLLPQIPDLEPASRNTYTGVYGYVYK